MNNLIYTFWHTWQIISLDKFLDLDLLDQKIYLKVIDRCFQIVFIMKSILSSILKCDLIIFSDIHKRSLYLNVGLQ